MSSTKKEEKTHSLFESRLMSILLMICLLVMCILFVVIIWTIFGKDSALSVIMYTGIGIGGGVIITLIILLISRKQKLSRNILLYITGGILVLSLLISLILKFSIQDPDLSSWAFIDASSVGLGLTTGIAIFYLILAMSNNKLVVKDKEKNHIENIEKSKVDENQAEINK
ncbi:MAG: hypothetical protein JXA54_12010 [Candidatus Heimdallarchaeota archaeon]|nr:hypothetical protein [Candidatus Heimdallarchaeota archaeon]